MPQSESGKPSSWAMTIDGNGEHSSAARSAEPRAANPSMSSSASALIALVKAAMRALLNSRCSSLRKVACVGGSASIGTIGTGEPKLGMVTPPALEKVPASRAAAIRSSYRLSTQNPSNLVDRATGSCSRSVRNISYGFCMNSRSV